MARSTQTLRDLYGPPCAVREVSGAIDAWKAFDACLRWAGYHARPEDTAFRNCRRITGGTGYSLHAYFLAGVIAFWNWVLGHLGRTIGIGLALDLNWKSNPYGPRVVTDMPRSMVDAICGIRTKSGAVVFRWGGYYSGNKDAMHFEIVASPAELASGIDPSTVPRSLSDPRPTPLPAPVPPEEDDMAFDQIVVLPDGITIPFTWPDVGPDAKVKVSFASWEGAKDVVFAWVNRDGTTGKETRDVTPGKSQAVVVSPSAAAGAVVVPAVNRDQGPNGAVTVIIEAHKP